MTNIPPVKNFTAYVHADIFPVKQAHPGYVVPACSHQELSSPQRPVPG